MKKIMIAAAAAALAGVTFAANVYDYKASVKYVDMKKQTLKVPGGDGATYVAYIKVVKSTTLKGYLVTSPNCACNEAGAYTYPGFLVVNSTVQPTETARVSGVKGKLPKIMPADLLVKVWRPKAGAKTWEAEGYLFAGVGKNVNTAITAAQIKTGIPYLFGDGADQTQATKHLFGKFNETPNGAATFYEAWLDAAGFGKAAVEEGADGEGCGEDDPDGLCLKNLAGSVIGGEYLCSANTVRGLSDEAGRLVGEKFLCWNWNGTTDVISGTWSIKAATGSWEGVEISAAEQALCPTFANLQAELELVKQAAQRLIKSDRFLLSDFDYAAAPVQFQAKWF